MDRVPSGEDVHGCVNSRFKRHAERSKLAKLNLVSPIRTSSFPLPAEL
jgi:hypothetical protein